MKKLFIWGVLCLLCSISAICQSKETWEKTKSANSIEAYRDFVSKYPNGKYSKEAREKWTQLYNLKLESAQSEFDEAFQQNTITAYEEFIQKSVNQKLILEAKRQIEKIKNEQYVQKEEQNRLEEERRSTERAKISNLVSDIEMDKIRKNLLEMSSPFIFSDLYNFTTSNSVPSDATIAKTIAKPNTDRFSYIIATIGTKIEVISISKGLLPTGLGWGSGDALAIFDEEYRQDYMPNRLFTLYEPLKNDPTGIFFKKIVIWNNPKYRKVTYSLINGKWYITED